MTEEHESPVTTIKHSSVNGWLGFPGEGGIYKCVKINEIASMKKDQLCPNTNTKKPNFIVLMLFKGHII